MAGTPAKAAVNPIMGAALAVAAPMMQAGIGELDRKLDRIAAAVESQVVQQQAIVGLLRNIRELLS